MRHTRKQENTDFALRAEHHEVPMRGRRNRKAAANSLRFFARIDGTSDYDGHVRGANGIRWRVM